MWGCKHFTRGPTGLFDWTALFFFFFLEASVDWSDRGGIVEVGWFLEAVSGAGHAEKKSSRPDSLQINLLAIMRFNVGLLSLRLHLNVIR